MSSGWIVLSVPAAERGVWYKAWQAALSFAVVAMMAATIVSHSGDLSQADVQQIIADQGLSGDATVT